MLFLARFAIRLWVLALFFALSGGFSATTQAAEAPRPLFAPLSQPLQLPPMLVNDPTGAPKPFAPLVQAKLKATPLLLIHLWATTCPPCQKEMQALDQAWPALQAQHIDVIALAQDPDGKIALPAFVQRYGLKKLPLYLDPALRALRGLQPRGLPVTYLVGAKGTLVGLHEGSLDWGALTAAQLNP